MGYENTLILLLFDFFQLSCALNGIVDEDFNNQLVDEDGLPISEKEYLKKNKFYNDDIISMVYYSIFEHMEIDLKELVSELIAKYFVFHYDTIKKQNIIRFIKTSNFESIYDLFIDRCDFATELITAYYDSIIDENKYYNNRGKVLANDSDFKILKKYDNSYCVLNKLLKESVVKLYNNYINNGFSDIDALTYTWAYFTHDFMPEGLFDDDTEEFLLETDIKGLSLSLIYADLYEHAMNQKMFHSDNEKENIASLLPILIVNFSMQVIPNDKEVRNRLLKHFILLQDDKELMKDNRIKTYSDDRCLILKKYNPYFTGDEIRY